VTPLDPQCAEVDADLREFALGIVSGRERSRVLDHVASCTQCRGNLEALSVVTDHLVSLAPHAEPPVGFESGLVDRYHGQSRRHPSRTLRNVALAAAALALVVVGFTLGNNDSPPVRTSLPAYGAAPISATLTSHGRNLGQLWMTSGTPAWIYVSLDDANWSGTAWCSVTLKNGHVLDVGVFTMVHGYGAWATRVDASSSAVKSAQVTDATGRVLASATLSA
jgi:hypothetical protein